MSDAGPSPAALARKPSPAASPAPPLGPSPGLSDEPPPRTVLENIQAVARVEREAAQDRSTKDRIADAIGTFAGTVGFVLLHLLWFAIWAAWNTGIIPGVKAFDPYPFQLLCMIVSLEGVLLSTFVLIKQNRMSLAADRRAHLDLQVNLLTEKEVTKLLQVLEQVANKVGADVRDPELRELEKVTAVDALAHELEERMPEPGAEKQADKAHPRHG